MTTLVAAIDALANAQAATVEAAIQAKSYKLLTTLDRVGRHVERLNALLLPKVKKATKRTKK